MSKQCVTIVGVRVNDFRACLTCRVCRKLTYPARCFLDLSEMPSRDMSLLNTTIPISMFTWERHRGEFDQVCYNRWAANRDSSHALSTFYFLNVSLDWRWLFNCPRDERLKVTVLSLWGWLAPMQEELSDHLNHISHKYRLPSSQLLLLILKTYVMKRSCWQKCLKRRWHTIPQRFVLKDPNSLANLSNQLVRAWTIKNTWSTLLLWFWSIAPTFHNLKISFFIWFLYSIVITAI